MNENNEPSNYAANNKNKWQPLWNWWSYSGIKWLLLLAGVVLIGVGILAYLATDI